MQFVNLHVLCHGKLHWSLLTLKTELRSVRTDYFCMYATLHTEEVMAHIVPVVLFLPSENHLQRRACVVAGCCCLSTFAY